jgi:hypothetical protein
MRPSRPLLVLGTALLVVLLFAGWSEGTRPVKGPHSTLELALLRNGRDLPWVVGSYFATSGRCAGCHGHDPAGLAMVDANGNDMNVVDDWRSTMMANSARDPFFRAKMDHEVLMAPGHGAEVENSCLSCHAPMGMHEERMLDQPPFTAAMLDTSALGLDGVSCLACHMQSPETAGSFFSGDLSFDSARVYGPYPEDQIHPEIMTYFVGWTPGYGEHMVDGRNCAGCHTLITNTFDLDGNYTGDQFVEQATYHEWRNSIYSASGVQCTTCHMPRISDPVILASEYSFLVGQTPFGKHHLVGGNVHMLELLKANREVLGIQATSAQFDSTIARSRRLLEQNTLDIVLNLVDRDSDTARFVVRLENRAGHRFPSGYPSRRAFIEFVVLAGEQDTVFKSGRLRGDLEVEGHGASFEPHYDMISSPDQVQIYELVMGDVNGNETTVLHRAKQPLKDNRLVPLGFSTTHYSYDTTRIVGAALNDPNFNRNEQGQEGSGTDAVRYHVPLNGYSGGLRARARVYYQPVPPAWNQEMFAHSTPQIDAFRDMLDAIPGQPTVVAVDSLWIGAVGMAERLEDQIVLHPNPSADGRVRITGSMDLAVRSVHDAAGQRQPVRVERVAGGWQLQLPETPGVYMVLLDVGGQTLLKRVLRL